MMGTCCEDAESEEVTDDDDIGRILIDWDRLYVGMVEIMKLVGM